MKNKHLISNTLKGVCIGSSMLIPGVSGGTVAIILNVYDELISAISSFFKNPKKYIITLLTIAGGGLIGILLFSKAILYITNSYTYPMMYLFMGAVLGSIPMLYKKAKIKKFSLSTVLYPVIGAAVLILVEKIPKDIFKTDVNTTFFSYFILFLVGIILSVALVLPGISVSYMLLIFGIYESTLIAIDEMQILYLLSLGLGVVIGILLSTKLLEKAMNNYPQATYLLIIGFVLLSLRDIFPGFAKGFEMVIPLVSFIIGFSLIYFISTRYDTAIN